MKPSIRTLSSVPTGRRVETFATRPGVGVGLGVPVGVGLGVSVGVGVGVPVGVGVGGESLSTIVTMADDGEPGLAPLGIVRVTENVSFPSTTESSAIGMIMFLVVSPAAKDNTPETAV